jgi:uncharacterized protein YbjT (DUF2867 family)
MPHHFRKSRVELLFRESPLVWTILQPAMYAQTPLFFLDTKAREITPGFDVNRPFTPVDIEDISEAAAVVLTEDGHEFATYELAAPDRFDFNAMAEALSIVLGVRVTARSVNPDGLAERVTERRGPVAASELRAMLAHYDAHGLVGNCKVLTMLLGRPPARFLDVMRREMLSANVALDG